MAKENVKKFYDEISKNKELQEKFVAVQKGYEPEGKSEEEIFEDIVLPIVKEAGYEFTMSEYREAQRDAMAEKGISEEELENVSGGVELNLCAIIGLGNDKSASICYVIGASTGTKAHAGYGGTACWYVGLGIGAVAHD